MHRKGDRMADVRASRYMAERLRNARFVTLPGDDHLPFFGDQDAVVALAQEFLTGTLPAADPERVLATVLFTDIVDSTRLAAEQGDRRWHQTLRTHNEVVRGALARFRGREVKTTGDGFLATFDGPARAIRAASTIRAELAGHGLAIRAGLHTGECELLDDDIGGIAVHIAARVLARAQPGELLCSRTVKDLVAGAGFLFTDRGTHQRLGELERFAHPQDVGRYDCVAIKRSITGESGQTVGELGFAFVAALDFKRYTYVWCRNTPAQGERGQAVSTFVRLDRACLAAKGRVLGTGYVDVPGS